MVDIKTVLDPGWEVGIRELIPNGLERTCWGMEIFASSLGYYLYSTYSYKTCQNSLTYIP